MAHTFPRQVCAASVLHHKNHIRYYRPINSILRELQTRNIEYGKARHRADLRKKQKIYDYILSSPQENEKTKNKKSSALPVVTSPTAQQQQITKTQLDTSSSLILPYTQCSTYYFLSTDLTKRLTISPTNKILTDQNTLKIYHAAPLHAARTPNHIPSVPRDYKLHSRQRRRLG